MTPLNWIEKLIRFVFDRKWMCKIGSHTWSASYEDYIEEFGFRNFPWDDMIASSAKCKHCGKRYSDTKRGKLCKN